MQSGLEYRLLANQLAAGDAQASVNNQLALRQQYLNAIDGIQIFLNEMIPKDMKRISEEKYRTQQDVERYKILIENLQPTAMPNLLETNSSHFIYKMLGNDTDTHQLLETASNKVTALTQKYNEQLALKRSYREDIANYNRLISDIDEALEMDSGQFSPPSITY